MARKPATTDYDDIVRATVPQTNLTMRPSKQEEQDSLAGPRSLTADEQALETAVRGALRSELVAGVDDIQIDIVRADVTLHGRVASAAALDRVTDIVRQIDGVKAVTNKLVVAP
jgi:osmotically-inducible protein OsmY